MRVVTERLNHMTDSCWWKLNHAIGILVQIMYGLASVMSVCRCRQCYYMEGAGDAVTYMLFYVMIVCICLFITQTTWAVFRMDRILSEDEDAFAVVGEDRSSELIAQHTSLVVLDAAKADASCSICMSERAAGARVRVLRCTHEFHAACVDVWLARRHKCPLCQREMDEPQTLSRRSPSAPEET